MPHKCKNCNTIIPDKSEELLTGCPDCENKSWEYIKQKSKVETTKEDKSQSKARTQVLETQNIFENLPSDSLQNQDYIKKTKREIEESENIERVDNVSEIQSELNKQYTGIEVKRKGLYEINLTELYRGNNKIIEIGDDGAYEIKEI